MSNPTEIKKEIARETKTMLDGLSNLSEAASEMEKDTELKIREYGRNFGLVVRRLIGYVQAVSEREDVDRLLTLEVEATKLQNLNLSQYLATALKYLETSENFSARPDAVNFSKISNKYLAGPDA